MYDIDEVIEGLAEYYQDLDCDTFISEPYRDIVPDLRVSSGERGVVFVFKLQTEILDFEEARQQWLMYDEALREWYLCVPEALQEASEEIIEELELENVTLCFWDVKDDEVYFYDTPDPDDD